MVSLGTIQFYTPMESAKSTLQLVNPSVGDSKRALDECDSDIFCGGKNIISVHNTCENTRVQLKDETMKDFVHMDSVYSVLSFLLKAPRTPHKTPVINALFQQRACMENFLRATRGLQPLNHMHLEWKMPNRK